MKSSSNRISGKDGKRTYNGFPVGYYDFNEDKAFNFQLNRWYSMGYLRYEDMEKAGRIISSFEDWKMEMLGLAEHAVSEGRYLNAAFSFRAAEFFLSAEDSDRRTVYKQFIEYFYKAADSESLLRVEVPYRETIIQALQLNPPGRSSKGTIVIHGGYDSYKEELFSMMNYFQEQGYEVITFETPWMGVSRELKEAGLEFEWEKTVGAILDHFRVQDVTLIGISMGGWLSLRAAAFEPRIKKVVASSVSYDVTLYNGKLARIISQYLFRKQKKMIEKSIIRKMKKDLFYAWFVNHLMYVTNKKNVVEAFDMLMQFTAENLHSWEVWQDVLILTGNKDHMVPFKMHALQIKALTQANSVTERIFTEEDCGQNHCQIGNLGLALETMLNWIERNPGYNTM
jgi:esterase/lipase